MSSTLIEEPYSDAAIGDLVSFYAGPELWSVHATEWIKGDGVKESIQRGTGVWIYRNELGNIVGYGSLGSTNWSWPKRNLSERISVIPSFAVGYDYRGKPTSVQKNDRYSSQIMVAMITKAHALPHDFLALEVHEKNVLARNFYAAFGFADVHKPRSKQVGTESHTYIRMAMRLHGANQPSA